MNDGILEKYPNNPSSPSETPEKADSGRKKSLFGNLNQDLKQALDTWETLTEQMAQRISPEEEQLLEVKRLLGELKSKLSEFED